jgi:hypothetical protein
MMAHWLRWPHGTVNNPKFRIVASHARARVADVIALWAALLEHASQARPRGSVESFDVEVTAFTLEIKLDVAERIMAEMARWSGDRPGLIIGGTLTDWADRQPKYEDSSAERTRRWRQRKQLRMAEHGAAGAGDGDL